MKRDPVRFSTLFILCVVSMAGTTSRAIADENAPGPAATQPQPASTSSETTNPQPEPESPPGDVALELSTTELSGLHDASLGLGWGSGGLAIGAAFSFHYSSLVDEQGYGDKLEQTETALAAGPWLRWDMFRRSDDRVGLMAALDVQYCRQSTTLNTNTDPDRRHAVAHGVIFRAGPGIRFWAAPWLAVGYTTQISVTTLWGPRLAFSPSEDLAPETMKFKQQQVALVGRFSVLALF